MPFGDAGELRRVYQMPKTGDETVFLFVDHAAHLAFRWTIGGLEEVMCPEYVRAFKIQAQKWIAQ